MLEMLFLTVFAANLNPCVKMLFAPNSSKQAEKEENYQGSINLKKVSGAVISLMSLKPFSVKIELAASWSKLLEM